MKYTKTLFLILFILSCSTLLLAQCPGTPPLEFTFESTESRCESNGSITLHITGGAPFMDAGGNPIYNNTIIAPIVIPVGGQADSVFSALAADTYTVEVADANGCTVTHDVTVPGTHMPLDLNVSFLDAICDGSGGGVICGTPDEGRPWPPGYYMYELFDASTTPPTSLGTPGLDSCFTDLATGAYQIRAYDSCGNFQTRDILLGIKEYVSTFTVFTSTRYLLCDSMCLILSTPNLSSTPFGEYPYDWEIIASTEPTLVNITGVFNGPSARDTICFTPISTGNFTIQVTDQCGFTATRLVAFVGNNIVGNSGYNCTTGGSVTVNTRFANFQCPNGLGGTWEVISVPPGAPVPPPQNNGTFTGLEAGQYCIEVTDCCGNVDSKCVTVDLPSWIVCTNPQAKMMCDNETVKWNPCFTVNGGPNASGLVSVVTSAPAGYSNPIPDTLSSFGLNVFGPPGQYCVTMYDDCGRRDSTCYDVDPDSLVYDYNIDITPGCVTGNEFTVNFTSNFNGYMFIHALNPFSNLGIAFNGDVFSNLTTGDYAIRWRNTSSNCDILLDTFTIPEYKVPIITGAWGIECTTGEGLITVQGTGGNTPYSYEIVQGPVTMPPQATPSFPGLPVGTYDIRMNDNCNNSSTTTVSIEPFAPVIQGYDGIFCLGDTAVLSVDFIDLATYSWTGPNGNTSDTSELIIDNITAADAGTYTIDIDVANPDQSACITQSLTINIEVYDCNDCQTLEADSVDICLFIDSNPSHPLAALDCDNGGVSNLDECASGENPFDPTDDCLSALNGNLDICAIINLDPNHPLAALDCDNGGVSNLIECQTGEDPADPADDCEAAAEGGIDICTIIAGGGHPWATLDCDDGGINNEIECNIGGDPGDPDDDLTCPSDPCEEAAANNLDICAILTADPTDPLATLDCDNGGMMNIVECDNGGDPTDPADDCDAANDGLVNICQIIGSDPSNPLAAEDCDGGGVSNADECFAGTDPTDPTDDCNAAIGSGVDICVIVLSDPMGAMANTDCDNGGISNLVECQNGGDPTAPTDDCEVAADIGTDICTLLDPDGDGTYNANTPWAYLDCDGGGASNIDECIAGTDPGAPSDDLTCGCHDVEVSPIDICTILLEYPGYPLASLDCDEGGVDNLTECFQLNRDPLDPEDDCGIANQLDWDICNMISGNPDHPFADQDCDGGGVINSIECANGSDPFDPSDDCTTAVNAGEDLCLIIGADPSHPLAELDCDNGGIDNYTECRNSGDPLDPNDDCNVAVAAGSDLCVIINNDPTHAWATLDCDQGGIDNITECAAGNNPSHPGDDLSCPVDLCVDAVDNSVDICAVLMSNSSSPLGTLDCDGGGVTNAVECSNNGDPLSPTDDCTVAEMTQLDICTMIAADPTHPLADVDCDGGGVSNAVECGTGENPFDPSDDCTAAIEEDLNICQLINYDPNHPLASLDCDAGGIDNFTECTTGGDPSEPTDDVESLCFTASTGDTDICAILASDPTHPIGQADCDEGGVTNADECMNGNDPIDPLDDCPDLTPVTTILPGNIAGISMVGVAVEITELNDIDTDGSAILVRMPSDPRLLFTWDPALMSVALTPVNNANWTYLGNNGVVHTFKYNGPGLVIGAGQTEAFGFEGTYDPQATDGQTTVTASIVPFGGGECNILNDTDSERLVYFE